MNQVKIGDRIYNLLNDSRLGILITNVKIAPSTSEFNQYVDDLHKRSLEHLAVKRETEFEIIKETRQAYKICGKEPSRYRPSAEALLRRLRTKRALYQINNVVDSINLISIQTHYSIGGFDLSNINGEVFLEVGDSEPYEAIGRGVLNIEFMPGLKDNSGFFGTPTSDSKRTMVTNNTTELMLIFYDFFGNDALEKSMEFGSEILKTYCEGETIHSSIVNY